MKTIQKLAILMGVTSVAAVSVFADPATPAATVAAPAPAAGLMVGAVPDKYAWDGSEYVGCIGSQYYYLNQRKYWVPMDRQHQTHFQSWQKSHADWQGHAVLNVNYRHDANGHVVPLAAGRGEDLNK